MADKTHIEWTDATWNPVTGCSVVSPGCTNCYAMKLAGTRLKHHPSRAGLTALTKAGPVWNGQVRFNAEWLDQPLRWTKPRRIFVCAHGDLFHEDVPDAWIDQVFAVMSLAPQHTFQVLTKRAARMRAYLTAPGVERRIIHEAFRIDCEGGAWMSADFEIAGVNPLPLPNVWLGVSIEDQPRADERLGELVHTPAAVRFISLEPMVGPVDLGRVAAPKVAPGDECEDWFFDALTPGDYYFFDCGDGFTEGGDGPDRGAIDWVILGGESGPDARPMHPDWARQVRDQCAAAGVPFFFKQWGSFAPNETGHVMTGEPAPGSRSLYQGRVFPDGAIMQHVGKKAAGRLLDGVEHNGMPQVRHG